MISLTTMVHTQERIYNYFDRNPQLHGLFIFDQMGVIINDLEDAECDGGYRFHVFQELSPYGMLVSGGDVTSARLFVRMSGRKEELGLVGYWDVVAWDEFEQQRGRNVDAVLIDTMQNYLANKSFNRGKGTHEASASMSFVSNTQHTVPYKLQDIHDRCIKTDTGWTITLGRGLDIFDKYNALSVAAVRQDKRKCRDFTVTYMKTK